MNGTEFNPDYTITVGKNRIASITLPNTATSIVAGGIGSLNAAFRHFTTLSSFSGNGLTSIGDWAFSYCTNLTQISLPVGITSISEGAFSS